MRQLAWLHAVPEGSKKSRMTVCREIDPDHDYLRMPSVDGAEYLIGLLHEAGLMSSSGMSAVPLSWQEIESWLRMTGNELELWERLLIRELSEIYVGELHQATDKNRPQPVARLDAAHRARVADKLLEFLRSKKKTPPTTDEPADEGE